MKRLSLEVASPTFDIALPGDTHIGSVSYHEKGVGHLIDHIASSGCYWAHMGDWIETITADDKRYAWSKENPIPLLQAQEAVKTFQPIADKCFCALIGNHELKLHRFGNLVKDVICSSLSIPYGAYMAHVEVKHEGTKLFSMQLWHGPSRGLLTSQAKDYEQAIANLKASLKMRLKYMVSDCAIQACGHYHRLLTVPPTNQLYIYRQGTKIKQGYLDGIQTGAYIDPDRRWYVCTGSFSKLYPDDEDAISYAEVSGYKPVELGYPVIHVVDKQIKSIEQVVV